MVAPAGRYRGAGDGGAFAAGPTSGPPGGLGRDSVERADGTVVPVAGCDSVAVETDGILVIETPGGGGHGPPEGGGVP